MIKRFLIFITGLLAGLLIVSQWRSYTSLSTFTRATRTDIFQEITLLIGTNQSLRAELASLQSQKSEYQSDYTAQEQLTSDLAKAQILAGQVSVSGPGIQIIIKSTPTLAELTDLLNELAQLGAEAISVNDIRLTNQTAGLASYGGQLVLGGQMLTSPFTIQAVGDSDLLYETLDQATGTLSALTLRDPTSEITLTQTTVTLPATE